MKNYEKPIVLVNEELSEGVYAASGDSSRPGCDSKYMNGIWQAPEYGWDVTVKHYYGCLGCPAYRYNGCGLLVDQAYLDGATSYDTDNGNRMPQWEAMGETAERIIDNNNKQPY